ncbi:MAG TPA: ribbon-helix-helix protein, CopG family [Mycobacterium sp.]|nr:ribbon-helix-helix protein, CopG family [Mycobacterium sp.]
MTKPVKKASNAQQSRDRLPETVDEATIERLAAEAEAGIPAEKLRRRGRPPMGDDAASTFSVRLPDDLVTLADERSAGDGVSRSETIRRALIEYLTR